MSPVVKSLPVLVLYPHARCNCRCVICDIWKETSSAELSADELSRHMADMERLSVKWVVFSGGEPLMHSDLFRLARMLKSKNIRVTLLSTGLLLERRASEIVGHIDDVIVSLDGPARIHDRIRNVQGAFQTMARGIEHLRERNPDFRIGGRCTVQHLNCDALVETASAARQLGRAT